MITVTDKCKPEKSIFGLCYAIELTKTASDGAWSHGRAHTLIID